MINFYDVIAASEGITVADEFAALWGRKISGGYVISTYMGTLPAILQTVAGYLLGYKIWGSTGGVGVETENLATWEIGGIKTSDGSDSEYLSSQSQIRTQYISCEAKSVYTLYIDKYPVQSFVAFYDNNKSYMSRTAGASQNGKRVFTSASGASYMRATLFHAVENQIYPAEEPDIKCGLFYGDIGGYKLPILSNDTATDIYIGDTQLAKDEYVDSKTGKIYRYVDGTLTPTEPPAPLPQIPTAAGETTISYGGTGVQPEKVELKYRR